MRWDEFFLFSKLHKTWFECKKPEFGMKKKTTHKVKDR